MKVDQHNDSNPPKSGSFRQPSLKYQLANHDQDKQLKNMKQRFYMLKELIMTE